MEMNRQPNTVFLL